MAGKAKILIDVTITGASPNFAWAFQSSSARVSANGDIDLNGLHGPVGLKFRLQSPANARFEKAHAIVVLDPDPTHSLTKHLATLNNGSQYNNKRFNKLKTTVSIHYVHNKPPTHNYYNLQAKIGSATAKLDPMVHN